MTKQRWISKASALLVLAALSHAADKPKTTAGKNDPKQVAPPAEPLVWPLPPDPPRVRWIAEYRDMAKIKARQTKKFNWIDKLSGNRAPDETLELKKPYGITTDKRGRIYIADTERQVVFVIDPKNKILERREGSSRAPMVLPVGLAIDAEERLFVSDAALHTVTCFNRAGVPVGRFGTTALARPGGIALDRERHRLYVADAKDNRLAVFDSVTFQFVAYIGGPGKPGQHPNGTFSGPTNVALDHQGNLYVADTGNYRIQVFDPTGKFVRLFGIQGDSPGEFIRPKGIALDSDGHVYVADAEFNNFQVFSPQGRPLLAVGVLGQKPGQFALIAGLHIDSENQIYTTEMFQGRVQVFQYLSRPDSAVESGVN